MNPDLKMASTPRPHGQETAHRHVDRLWEHQLRKENKALLDQISKINKQHEADFVESERRRQETDDRLDVIELEIQKIENERQQAVRASERTMVDLREALSRLGERVGKHAANGNFFIYSGSSQGNEK